MAETASPLIPIVEHLPNAQHPYPTIDKTAPVGTVGHPDAALEHEPIKHKGKVIAGPPGYDQAMGDTNPPVAQVEKMLGEPPRESNRWIGRFFKRQQTKEELPKAA